MDLRSCGVTKWPLRLCLSSPPRAPTPSSNFFCEPHTFPESILTPKYIYTMARLSFLLLGALSTLSGFATASNSAVKDLIPTNFDEVVLAGKPALVEFFAPWCGHCKTLAPVYEELAQSFAFAENKVTIAKVDADENRSLGKRFGIQGFPTVKWFDGKSDKPEEYNGGRDLDSLTAFVTEKTGIKPRSATAQKVVSNVEMLNDASFKTVVGGDKDVLVAFTAPWCGRELIPQLKCLWSVLLIVRPSFRLQDPRSYLGNPRQRLRPRVQRRYR